MQEIARELTKIGLSAKQADVYVALQKLGEATAYKIAEECEVKKPTVYVILEELRRLGLVLKVPHAKKQLFSPRDLDEHLSAREKDLASARRMVPVLDKLREQSFSRVLFFQGLRGIRESLQHKLGTASTRRFDAVYGDVKGVDPAVLKIFRAWDDETTAEGVEHNIIIPGKEAEAYYPITRSPKTKIREASDLVYPGDISIEIAEDFVRIIAAKDQQATIIENKNVAAALRQMWSVLWKQAKPLP